MSIAMRLLQLRSGGAHCDLEFAVGAAEEEEVQCIKSKPHLAGGGKVNKKRGLAEPPSQRGPKVDGKAMLRRVAKKAKQSVCLQKPR